MLALLMLLSQRRNKKKQVINLDQDVQVCGDINIYIFLWMVYELIFMNHPSPLFFLDVGYLFLSFFFDMPCGHMAYLLLVCIFFETCSCEHVAYLLWVCIFYFFV